MRPTIAVNLGGLQFIFNDNAYRLMSEYLASLADAFRAQHLDADGLTYDIENRCAEILAESHDRHTYIITESDVTALIDRMGRPEEIVDVSIETTPDEERVQVHQTPPPYESIQPQKVRKRLYRIRQGAELGGVCGGLAAYLNWDPTYVRLITVALAFLSCSTVAIAYIILWIVIPQAKTPWQEMELRGESPTLNNIGNTVKKIFGYDDSSDSSQEPYENLTRSTRGHKAATRANKFFSGAAKVLLALVGLLCVLIVVSLIGITVFGFVYGINELIHTHTVQPYFFTKLSMVMCATLIVGIPLSIAAWLITRALFNPRRQWRISQGWRLTFFIIWTAALICCMRLAHEVQHFPDTSFFF